MLMKLVEFPQDVKYGSIFDLGKDHWWTKDQHGERSIPLPPEFDFDILEYNLKGAKIEIIGMLSNSGSETIEIPVFPSPDIFVVEIEEDEAGEVKYIGNPRYLSPPPHPHVLVVPPECQIIFTRYLELSNYSISKKANPKLSWKFITWDDESIQRGYIEIIEKLV